MAPIERETGRGRWEGEEYFLTQEFVFSEPRVALDAREILREADALVNQRSQAATLWLARWRDDSLMLGPICILRFGPLRAHGVARFTAAAGRAIDGGLIARRPGGTMWYRVRSDGNNLLLTAGISGFIPRLPRFAFQMVQLPLHRATVRRAMRNLAAQLDS